MSSILGFFYKGLCLSITGALIFLAGVTFTKSSIEGEIRKEYEDRIAEAARTNRPFHVDGGYVTIIKIAKHASLYKAKKRAQEEEGK